MNLRKQRAAHCIALALLIAPCARAAEPAKPATVTISADTPVNTFLPSALGAGLDGHHLGDEDRMLSPANIKPMLSAGLGPISYRLRTELAVDAWHWNPSGTWSDPAHKQGYWISDSHSRKPIDLCYGYHLPRRGDTLDEANDDGYSRIDDGDPATFWKSNPYLDAHFTGEDNALHPQWVVIDFGEDAQVNAIRIHWANPYATRFVIDYSRGDDPYYWDSPPGIWTEFPNGRVDHSKGGDQLISLAPKPVTARYVRITMSAASGTAPAGSTDIRDHLGYAIREIDAGFIDPSGAFHDLIVHVKHKRQTGITVSSTDPWHRAIDRDDQVEQPGFDLIERSGLTRGLPMLAPVPIVYDTPENAAAEIAFLKSRRYLVPRIEMGEEPDGQKMNPSDYGALYLQWADALHRVSPSLKLGGPSFVNMAFDKTTSDWQFANGWWISHFLALLRDRHRSADYTFLSFEWYPFDETSDPPAAQIPQNTWMMQNAFELIHESGIPKDFPILISEYGYSAYFGQAEVDLPGALLNADIAGLFLTLGGETAYLYGYEPNRLEIDFKGSWGKHTLFLQNPDGSIRSPVATYHAARMVTQDWLQPGSGRHQIYPASANIKNPSGEDLVTAYAIRRPDKCWSILLINKDPVNSYQTQLHFQYANEDMTPLPRGPWDQFQFSAKQYAWQADGENGHPARSDPPSHETLPSSSGAPPTVLLPPYSLTVVRSSP